MLKHILETFNYNFTLFLVFPLIIGVGCYLTFRLRFVQVVKLKRSFFCLTKKNDKEEGNISRFEAVAAVLAGNFGTGNISGMAVALATGGPGALIWMWVMAFFGAAIQYASCILGISYRQKTKSGEHVGGPMYYLRDGVKSKALASIFAICTVFGAVAAGNFAQINSIVLPLEKMGMDPLYCGLGVALFVAIVILGGIQRLASFASIIVPFKAAAYLGTAFIILGIHYEAVLPALKLMVHEAFNFQSLLGGVAGAGVLKAITTGFDRGLFATDAGTGIVPILQASARSEHPVVDGIATLIAPLMVMIVCTSTGLVLIVTGAFETVGLQSTNMVTYAFSKGLNHPIGGYIVLVALILFAYTTILEWAYCGEKAVEFLFGAKAGKFFKVLFIFLVPFGTLIHIDMIWILADMAIMCMLFVNVMGVLRLSSQVIEATHAFDTEEALAAAQLVEEA